MGYNADVIKKAPNQVSWAELLNKKWKGRVVAPARPGHHDARTRRPPSAALGLMKFKDFGNPTKAEIDRLFKILTKYKKQGQFRAFWSAFNDSVNLMVSKEVVIESMWSPAVALLKAAGREHPLRGAARGLPRLVQRRGDLVEGHRPGEAAGLLRLHQLELQRVPRRRDHAPGLLHRQRAEAAPVDQVRRREEGRLHAGRVRLLVAAASRPPRTCRASPARSATSRRASVATAARSSKRICKYSSWNSFRKESVYLIKRVNDFLSA